MNIRIIFLGLFFSVSVYADSLYYCNGNYKKSGSSWYYPDGSYAQSGSSTYYMNGNYLKSGSSLYYRNGNYLRSGSSLYYDNGNYLKSGSTVYYRNGNYLKSGTSCYYDNGNRMGECPSFYNIDLGSESNALEARLNLSGDVSLDSLSYRFQYNSKSGGLHLDGDGNVLDIMYSCSDDSSDVSNVLSAYKNLTGQGKATVRNQICGQ